MIDWLDEVHKFGRRTDLSGTLLGIGCTTLAFSMAFGFKIWIYLFAIGCVFNLLSFIAISWAFRARYLDAYEEEVFKRFKKWKYVINADKR